jgi:hypothetical protein
MHLILIFSQFNLEFEQSLESKRYKLWIKFPKRFKIIKIFRIKKIDRYK